MLYLLSLASWVGLSWLVIVIDQRMVAARDATRDPTEVDLRDRSPGMFLALMVIFGGFVVPFYLWHSRRSVPAVAAGFVLMGTIAVMVAGLLAVVGTPPT